MAGFKFTRMRISALIGMGLGVLCVLGNLFTNTAIIDLQGTLEQVMWLLFVFVERLLLGITIGLAGHWKLIHRPILLNPVLRGLLLGALFSFHMAFFTSGLFGVAYLLMGLAFGLGNDLISTLLSKMKQDQKDHYSS